MNPTSVSVVICTYHRNGPLQRLLLALVAVSASASSVADIGVVIVDDDADGGARVIADRFAESFALGVRYERSGLRNISVARNKALAAGIEMADWVAMIDDDCLPVDEWIVALIEVQRRTDADAVTGSCPTPAPPNAPSWLTSQPFLTDAVNGVDGQEPEFGATKNTMIRSRWLVDHPEIRFERSLGRLGGEDTVFFYRARDAGLVHRFSAAASVAEMVPAERTTFRYNVRTRYWYGNSQYVTTMVAGRATRRRWALRGSRRMWEALVSPIWRIAHGRAPQWRWATAEVACAAGMLAGLVGIRVNHH